MELAGKINSGSRRAMGEFNQNVLHACMNITQKSCDCLL